MWHIMAIGMKDNTQEGCEMENMTKIKNELHICSLDEFTPETDKEDGSLLNVVDESTHKVVGSYVAYHGFWNKR